MLLLDKGHESNLHPVMHCDGDCRVASLLAMTGKPEELRADSSYQNSSPFFSIPWMPFSPFTVCVTWKSTASEQN